MSCPCAELLDERDALLGPLSVRIGFQNGRAEVHVQPDHRQTRVLHDAPGDVDDGFDVEAELHALHAGIGLDVRLRRQVRVHAQRDVRLHAELLRDGPDRVQLLFTLHVEEEHAVLQREFDLAVRLADAREHDLRAARSRFQRAGTRPAR